ncbi:ornithine-acyl[acyl carrier protein] N-acyltransferase [Trichormus variabilis ATCC 29413]|uniref:Ornithine-acyl[acyl carrier protein] N-acyltransferase n=2 Tax=Anabaena variabilis TaxID=264691 RepID=Q3M9K4_TRIV2|nr:MULTISPECIES: GNAT family N-acetyltransferase [Nostocaceae]ABA22332.1 ornithine-acyl[acyl carrier protein] N-acyltransferase [Trichormus variabilis ATCC 29413]MBC1216317.1 GNAT family N-acetyltransferase [Trichormus variabilis ARAD]MBC1255548.1 GNAT family N-acetyltransferase [Trichormus variabilis V5]MBC1269175.1 GNAT family N-acetyltransferase [Trichormus variabilis FSR]MBC1304549.1 GNAT family N-acetyltransferase [Trichormus variabilis N2B]
MEISYHHIKYPLRPPTIIQDFPILETDRYILKLAETEEELASIFCLRFEVFNVELGLGLADSNLTKMDQDEFDTVCHHLMLISKLTGKTIGTYRMQTYKMASQGLGFDAADIFELKTIPESVLKVSVEVGRACIAKEYRSFQSLLLLWKGLADYLILNCSKYFFGCASLLTQCSWEAACAYHYFEKHNLIHKDILVFPHAQFYVDIPHKSSDVCRVDIPNILQAYLNVGARICSLPAIDREFKTIDFLTIANIKEFTRWNYPNILDK